MNIIERIIAWIKEFFGSFGEQSRDDVPPPVAPPEPVPEPPNPRIRNGVVMMTKKDLEQLQARAFRLFNYEFDDRQYNVMEDWRSHADVLAEGKEFTDDCDGYAFTVCETLINMGAPKENIKFIVCETETGEGHAVAGYTLNDKTYILENRYREVYDWTERPGYIWNFFMKFDEPGQWYKITNS